jgi:hypothetical protein
MTRIPEIGGTWPWTWRFGDNHRWGGPDINDALGARLYRARAEGERQQQSVHRPWVMQKPRDSIQRFLHTRFKLQEPANVAKITRGSNGRVGRRPYPSWGIANVWSDRCGDPPLFRAIERGETIQKVVIAFRVADRRIQAFDALFARSVIE